MHAEKILIFEGYIAKDSGEICSAKLDGSYPPSFNMRNLFPDQFMRTKRNGTPFSDRVEFTTRGKFKISIEVDWEEDASQT